MSYNPASANEPSFTTAAATPSSGNLAWTNLKINSPFGNRTDPINGGTENHKGIDLPAPKGTVIGSTVAGTVVYAGMGQKGSGYGGYGNAVGVKDADGNVHVYGHLDSVNVKAGQQINAGDVIGKSGNTGNVAGPNGGYHLHYEVRKNGVLGNSLDPTPYLNGGGGGSSTPSNQTPAPRSTFVPGDYQYTPNRENARGASTTVTSSRNGGTTSSRNAGASSRNSGASTTASGRNSGTSLTDALNNYERPTFSYTPPSYEKRESDNYKMVDLTPVNESAGYNNYWKSPAFEGTKDMYDFRKQLDHAIVRTGVPKDWVKPLTELFARESSLNPNAKNSTSTASGYAQFLSKTKADYEKKYGIKYDSPENQLILGIYYVMERYGNPVKALVEWDKKGFY